MNKRRSARITSGIYLIFWFFMSLGMIGQTPSGFEPVTFGNVFVFYTVIAVGWFLGYLSGKE